jgi:adenosylcobinamide-GDP ribazoletransferase
MYGFLIALQFLTRLPVHTATPSPRQTAESHYFYPFVGLLIGLAAVLLRRTLTSLFPISFSMTLVLAFLIWITGGLHEDGLADVADAMGGGWTRDERLQIMKDSRIGAFGASVLIVVLLAKYAALTSMVPDRLDASILTAQTLGRWAFLPLGYFNRHAREGLGSEFTKMISAEALGAGTLLSIAAAILLCRVRGAVSFACALAVVVLASGYFRRRIGGVTGDCFGAVFHFVEITTYAVYLA